MLKKSFLFLLPVATIFAQDAQTPAGGISQTLLMIGIALVFFYFILWRPEQKRRKAADEMRNALKVGDQVTAMGILGSVDKIKEHTIILKMIEGAKIEMLKGAITSVESGSQEKA